MLRTALAILAMMFFVGTAHAVTDATSEDDAIQLDQNTQPSSPDQSLQNQPSDQMGPAEQRQMNESDDINQ